MTKSYCVQFSGCTYLVDFMRSKFEKLKPLQSVVIVPTQTSALRAVLNDLFHNLVILIFTPLDKVQLRAMMEQATEDYLTRLPSALIVLSSAAQSLSFPCFASLDLFCQLMLSGVTETSMKHSCPPISLYRVTSQVSNPEMKIK